jgi:hypothetical protein
VQPSDFRCKSQINDTYGAKRARGGIPVMLRYLRIAVTALSLTVCVLLVALWVRSYRWRDCAYIRITDGAAQHTYYDASSNRGGVTILAATYPTPLPTTGYRLKGMGRHSAGRWPNGPMTPQFSRMGFAAFRDGVRMLRYLTVPHWFLVSIFGGLTVGPWIRHLPWRFSLRTLLIATTLVAVVLGIVYAAA